MNERLSTLVILLLLALVLVLVKQKGDAKAPATRSVALTDRTMAVGYYSTGVDTVAVGRSSFAITQEGTAIGKSSAAY